MERALKEQARNDSTNESKVSQGRFARIPAQTDIASRIDNSPRMVAQRKLLQCMFGNAVQFQAAEEAPLQGRLASSYAWPVLQAKTNVKTNLNDGTDDKTSNKLIDTPTQGEKWFRFAKNDKVINSFANNITTETPAGANPVNKTIDLANYPQVTQSEIPSMTRSTHFQMGDSLAGMSSSNRTNTWTWHHKVDKYKMELVDMYTHGGFYHYGGFSQWDMDDDDATD
jgi:hypothetical protein